MNPCDVPLFLHPTRSEIGLEIRRYLIALLNQTLACTVDLRSHVKQAAWNVKGKDFAQLQALFTSLASELDAYADLLAERIAPYATALRASLTHAADVEDAGTAAVYTDITRGVEKRLWGLEAYLQG